jgi:signal transduction histidine kinase
MAPFSDVHYEMRAEDGTRRLFRLSGVPVFDAENGRFAGFRGSARDVTAQASAEARIFTAQSRLVHAIESIPQGFALFDADDRLLLCNSSYEQLLTGTNDAPLVLGTRYAEILRRAASSGQFAGSPEDVERLVQTSLRHHRNTVDGFEINLNDGRWALMSVDRTDDGGTVEVWNDITELRLREAAIRAAEEEARAARDLAEAGNRAKGEFLATMSHELRTPLNAIIGFSEIIKNEMYGPVGKALYKDYAGDIHSSGKHLLSLISDILEFAKIEAGDLALGERSINLAALLESCIRIVAQRAEQGELSLEMKLPQDLPRLKADETRLRQIVINLLGNAVKFTPPGGRVTLVANADSKTGCQISVRDTGIGMAKEDIPRALLAFGQIESQLSRRYEGTGLGLTLAKSLTEMHGGRLTIDSEPNVGTIVTIHLPASRILPRNT